MQIKKKEKKSIYMHKIYLWQSLEEFENLYTVKRYKLYETTRLTYYRYFF